MYSLQKMMYFAVQQACGIPLSYVGAGMHLYGAKHLSGGTNMKKRAGKTAAIVIACLCVVAVVAVIIVDCISSKGEYSASTTLMNTVVKLDISGEKAEETGEKITKRIAELENSVLSKFSAASAVSEINESAGDFVDVSLFSYETGDGDSWNPGELVADVAKRCAELAERSGGAFSPILGKVIDLWGFGTDNAGVPDKTELEKCVSALKSGKLEVVDGKVKIPVGTALDFGAVGKGVACEEVRKVLESTDTERAIVAVGGSILLYGEGESFTVGVRNPLGGSTEVIGHLTLGPSCVSTSGAYERYFMEDGERYHHILVPSNGFPVKNDLLSVTVISEDGFLSDALSTTCFVLGYEKSLELLESYNAQALFIFDDKRVRVTSGLTDCFEMQSDDFLLSLGEA